MKTLLLDLLFPRFCLNCGRDNFYLCQDCLSLLDFAPAPEKNIAGLSKLYFACDYRNFIIKKLMRKFKYPPFAKELAAIFCLIIINYFANLEKYPKFLNQKENCLLVPVPLSITKQKRRGFNQSEEIAKELSRSLSMRAENILIKTKETTPQMELSKNERKQNLKNVFAVADSETKEKIKDKIIILVDDVFTTGATMSELAKTLKPAKPKQIIGLVVARD